MRENGLVTDQIEVIYDAAVAAEKLKDGTKYERLTAIVFKILRENSYVVHDLRLRGDGRRTMHQIDVVVSSGPLHTAHRILVECKDHGEGTKVGLEEILAFNGRLIQFPGSRGIFVTTVGYTKSACSYAYDEHITLVQLRPFTDADSRYCGRPS
jgi:restriction endonuclease Mrr